MQNSALRRDTARPWASLRVNTRRSDSDAPRASTARKGAARALECLICSARHTREDVLTGLYQITTKVCSACYSRMQAAPHSVHCFGKPDFVLLNGARLLGYSGTSRECQELCPDRALCASVADPASYNPGE